MKHTKRQAFNFLRSYFDVLNKIPSDDDKLNFLLSVINKQFLDEDPTELNFIVELAYESQRHSIEKSVKGYKDKKKTDLLGNPTQVSVEQPKQDPCEGGAKDPKQQEKEKEKEKEEEEGKDERHFSINVIADEYKCNDRIIKAVLNNGLKLASNKEDLLSKVDDFVLHLETTGETTKQKKDFNSHFLNWIKIQKKHEPLDTTNETLQERAARLMKEEMNR